MKTVGVIVEYNPFHNGHRYHLQQARKQCHADYVVAIMSGNFVQRGIPAITDKYTRTAMALAGGADVVLELPVFYATASAETFAGGAVSILNALGSIDCLCFGAEDTDLSLMQTIADILIMEPPAYTLRLKQELSAGKSFPAARRSALLPLLYDIDNSASEEELIHFLESSNNILGIEYLKALQRLQSKMTPVLVKRHGSLYNEETLPQSSLLPSATALRKNYLQTNSLADWQNLVPDAVFDLLHSAQERTFPVVLDDFSEYLYHKLLFITYEELLTYVDISPDLARRILHLKQEFTSISSFAEKLKTKQFTLTRIQRVLLHLLLEVKKEMQPPFYARLLGFRREASHLLDKSTASLPIVTKTADYKELLAHDIQCANLYNHVIFRKYGYKLSNDYVHPLIIQ